MRLENPLALCLIAVLAAMACAAAPATGPEANPRPAMPPGHPPMPSMGGNLPTGHPPVGAMAPSTQPIATHGTLTIRAFQGSKGGRAIGAEAFTVDLYHRDVLFRSLQGKLEERGVAVLERVPLDLPFYPLVRINHAGVEYRAAGELMDGRRPEQTIDVAVYETTDEPPAWSVRMRHVIVEPEGDSLHVTEMLVIDSPGDRAFPGIRQADGRMVSMILPLPAGAKEVELGEEMLESFARSEKGDLVRIMPLLPGAQQYQFGYTLPLKDGKARLSIDAPAAVKHMMLFVPEQGSVTVQGLDAMGTHDTGKGRTKVFRGADLKAGHQMVLDLAVPVPSKAATSLGTAPKIIAGVGGALILAVGTGIVLLKAPKNVKG